MEASFSLVFMMIGNRQIHLRAGGVIGLIDYGQSKRLPDAYRASFARLVKALAAGEKVSVCSALDCLGVVTDGDDVEIKAQMAKGM
jgi:predicted unusual protein kinase regulating ubiquinone biosynthesis (AarF/ABC1/UbiB family)